ncbi:hypothetical protein [Microcoleus sp. FACHB-68]|nr:hypothetical protein [Microcoleus sp. FACHB-68]MBD1938702.1 hypothetical protein [Microcoleus sp. FACHB-68]
MGGFEMMDAAAGRFSKWIGCRHIPQGYEEVKSKKSVIFSVTFADRFVL